MSSLTSAKALSVSPSSGEFVDFTLLQYNVDMANREEKYEDTKWSVRADRVEALIRYANADVVVLQELRNHPGYPPIEAFLARFGDVYGFQLAYRNASPLAFGQAVLYRRTKFMCTGTANIWFTADHPSSFPSVVDVNDKNDNGSLAFSVDISPIKDGVVLQRRLEIYNIHLPMGEDAKMRCVSQIDKALAASAFIVSGDFNFFSDKDGDKQRAVMTKISRDAGVGAVASHNQKQPLGGSFVGYEHDSFKADVNNMTSRLDHVFVSNELTDVATPVLFTNTMLAQEPEPLSQRNSMPSDHLPLLVSLRWTL